MTERPDLRSLYEEELVSWVAGLNEPPYRGRQLARWIHGRGARSFEAMTDLPASLRRRLAEEARLATLRVLRRTTSADGSTTKYLLACEDGSTVESVWMRYADGRRSACVSTQVGCGMGCTFCATGLSGFGRNLTAGEITDQVHVMQHDQGERVTHVVFMGMGEPLANLDASVRAVRLLNAAYGLRVGVRRITVSTVGLVPQIRRLAQLRLGCTLAVSLHAPDDELRSQLVPINRRYPIRDLLEACQEYTALTGRRVTFEYVLLEGVNDTPDHARRLAERLQGLLAHVNLIPWNPVPSLPYRRPGPERVRQFARIVRAKGVPVTVRVERGVDILAACGQLREAHTPGKKPVRLAPHLLPAWAP
ncbi:MAG: 23S rRNA (adenine(2503)-C(2))-methyltransferase RlmN [Armatimonadota bacterium]|nr:23S rRNA (adenine(2503)-C(2))-methyltransferase RlmN [Armatimonadota bacterium]MDR7593622.1 23S rRNA (adenine(2503)-C(2))-methyltransferase RlmN [Armatimonadota bacterium]